MIISITFKKDTNAFAGINYVECVCESASINDGFLKVKDKKGRLYCYNTDIIEAYTIE